MTTFSLYSSIILSNACFVIDIQNVSSFVKIVAVLVQAWRLNKAKSPNPLLMIIKKSLNIPLLLLIIKKSLYIPLLLILILIMMMIIIIYFSGWVGFDVFPSMEMLLDV